MHGQPVIEVRGQGPDLVLLHGWGMHRGVWGNLADQLSSRWRLHLVDLPGHGTSQGQALSPHLQELAALVAAQTPPASWLGWSMGGLISLQAAIDMPAQVDKLVLISTNPSFVQRPHWKDGVDEWVFRGFARDLKSDFRGTLNRFLLLETLGSDTARASLKRLKSELHKGSEPDVHALRSGLSILQETDYTKQLGSIENHALWLAGGRDRLVPPAAQERAASMMSHAVYHRVPGAGHAPFIGHGDECVRHIESFLKQESAT
jgi:pimeloyl-[acyl-carrier protein] methyl ester esterase